MLKTITIRNAVYDELLMVKKKGESFSELLERLAKSEDRKHKK
ncbi:MAG: antitoxin VapB family protein [Candidatus Thermoplasmatota archaeon]|nr:antitoxin VapB family protein [Candidatus Thermoplasmatota archaeon]MCL5889489.1 antitoxin VapB family protein [Candidatus Thermoplasmatota archaeon]